MTNPFAARSARNSWMIPLSLAMLVLGFMISLAWITDRTRDARISLLGPDQQQRIRVGTIDLQEEYATLSNEVKRLRNANTKMENAIADDTNKSKLLNESLQTTKAFAALTEVEGPGITIVLRDYHENKVDMPVEANIIHDVDVLRVVNELWNAGAEAISIAGIRVGPRTNFRCVGSVILVDSVKIASPITVSAIGDPETLKGAMELPGGIISELRETAGSAMVQIGVAEKMKLPAYVGGINSKFIRTPKDKP